MLRATPRTTYISSIVHIISTSSLSTGVECFTYRSINTPISRRCFRLSIELASSDINITIACDVSQHIFSESKLTWI